VSLLLDLGNTRLKAALRAPDGALQPLGEARHRDTGVEAALATALDGAELRGIERALCANVAGESAGRALADALRARGVLLEFLRASREAHGVRCAYEQPTRLGADRWAALLGARGLVEGPCLVVDAGSALTIDAMDAGGRHLGGWILPGLAMMVEALEARTGDLGVLRRASAAQASGAFPADTGPAMEQGARLAAVGAIQAAWVRLQACASMPARLLLTGGDGPGLAAELAPAELVQDLVLRGLARAAS
jgi:type III pantothenate kinase